MRFLLPLLLFLPAMLRSQATFDSLTLIDSRVVYFDFGKAELRPEADSVLAEIPATVSNRPGLKIHLTAHTDAIGQDESNEALSRERAASVRTALLALGLPDSTLVVETFGESIPVAENDSEEGRQLNRRVTLDFYEARRMRYLEGQVRDEVTGDGIQADIVLRGKDFQDSLRTDTVGKFRHPVPDNTVIGVDVFAKDHFFESEMFKVEEGVVVNMELPSAKEGEVADISNLYFVGNQAILLKRSEPELPKVLRFMEVNPHLRIEIAGHINRPNSPPVPKDSWNWQLSEARAKLIYDYLLQNNVDSTRISYEGYGNTQMRYPYARSEREQALNRRVEIRVIGQEKK
ncbi:OmpA family protein [Flavilitoribacter nigricans]|nr:OmpA family protein [Flavilitoribacter nigricans]